MDRPGWDGRSRATDLAGNGAAAIARLDAAGVDRAVVAGHSFGGAVAAWLAVHHPERVEALVLAAPAANSASLTRLDYLLAAPLAGPVASAGMLAGVGSVLCSPLRHGLARRLGLKDGYLRRLGRLLIRPPAWRSFVVEQRALVKELPPLESELGRITAPTVIVAGEGDRIVPVAAARKLATQIRGAELMLVPRAGHLLPHRHAGGLAQAITGLAGVGSR